MAGYRRSSLKDRFTTIASELPAEMPIKYNAQLIPFLYHFPFMKVKMVGEGKFA